MNSPLTMQNSHPFPPQLGCTHLICNSLGHFGCFCWPDKRTNTLDELPMNHQEKYVVARHDHTIQIQDFRWNHQHELTIRNILLIGLGEMAWLDTKRVRGSWVEVDEKIPSTRKEYKPWLFLTRETLDFSSTLGELISAAARFILSKHI